VNAQTLHAGAIAGTLEVRCSIWGDEAVSGAGPVRDSWLSVGAAGVMAVGGGGSPAQRARATGSSLGVSDQVTTLKCD